ncbi:UPF0746 protein DDB_G0281095-like [Sabethes cyaneus]|uniref:UPF0746 protein DDB_G0281095-like n=1 Tax=Sabethes cyaneus TaxID=53552 RepID=UPI00237DBC63|nr:UPF0746 protein DDB_G0281095-like [Sabethes cyaneus]
MCYHMYIQPKLTCKKLWTDYYNFGSLTDDLYGRSTDSQRQLSHARFLARKNGQNFPCLKCGKWYSTRSIMLRHMNHECGVEKKIQCKFCYKKFRRKWNLEQHIKRLHLSEKRKHQQQQRELLQQQREQREQREQHREQQREQQSQQQPVINRN